MHHNDDLDKSLFSGVNEMQTVANKRGLHVQTQIDINNTSLKRLEEYYSYSKAALQHQLAVKAPEYYQNFLNNQANTPTRISMVSPPKNAHASTSSTANLSDGRSSISAVAAKVELMHDRY